MPDQNPAPANYWNHQRGLRFIGAAILLRLARLALTDFRNYTALDWQPESRITVISGPNGSGKTNLLEAVSMLVPGRGLRGARNAELVRHNGPERWAVAGRLQTPSGMVDLGAGTPPGGPVEKRVFRLNGAAPRSGADLAAIAAAIWLTPQMDRLFLDPASGRRRFLDRLVWALEPGHAREIAAHDTAIAGRNRLLAQGQTRGGADPAWLAGLEDSIARHAVAAAAARASLVTRMNRQAALPGAAFPPMRIALRDPVATRLQTEPAVAAEAWLRACLREARDSDAQSGSTAFGAHRADMMLRDAATDRPASLASTGQQKALLIGVVLAHAMLVHATRGFAPLLLLDEPMVHLDTDRRAALCAALAALPAQILMTGTDRAVFAPLRDLAGAETTGVCVSDAALDPDPYFSAG